jgi:hypothetical protein
MGQHLLSEALSALGVKDKHTKREEPLQIGINPLPWPRSEIVSIPTDEGIGAQSGNGKQFAIIQADAYGASTLDVTEVQLQMVGAGATSTPIANVVDGSYGEGRRDLHPWKWQD